MTINQIINVIKESKIDELSISLNGLRISHLPAYHHVESSVRSETAADCTMDLTDLSEAIRTNEREEINVFSSKIIQAQTKTMFLGNGIYVMMQALGREDGSHLHHMLGVMNTYTEMATGSK